MERVEVRSALDVLGRFEKSERERREADQQAQPGTAGAASKLGR